jgi:hypothetical protein
MGFAKVCVVEEILQDAPVAQIRGGFINIWDGVCESVFGGINITRIAGFANKRRIYKYLGWGLRKCVWWKKYYKTRRLRK